ncbi:preprotein translocase subunit SecE [Candidatus Collierbacteria bacterium CG1_02_44_10]|uniref:Protein translocase subunit SecE n=4 Tax=Candidatus Collieribacteriota TaxID=1752725 RepID=A0A2H0DWU7_9BACT|nr:preprotein translocase subunit SecE [bacterium]OIN90986.1 MAG: preprotein translocase subunit SecE [Candidatus Collierbacteria bacterium CG1_02_44_10]PIP86050.1 MAG: preprotein translocase subunit SecE [Candidatus Collierbacteria bacterium CG22_combo_CG10-13_8_21_14_all_43_12]PIR99889.1 MAG: preprotein translocase subunit SecE [Candidatus Collierbacteria bacterium CG10_big_fil_rev_8_21_14_0_10_43_36]PIZ24582.1 MAG: preprotein translocase subunit SecE [Candidatus Collierbacteria bacterium CG_
MFRPLEFLRSVKLELAQVKWPSHKEAMKMTVLVIVTTIIVAIYSGGLDYIFTAALQTAINR